MELVMQQKMWISYVLVTLFPPALGFQDPPEDAGRLYVHFGYRRSFPVSLYQLPSMLCFQPSDSFPHQVPEPLFFSSFGFSIILEVATPPQQEVSRCFRFSTLDACPSGFSEVPSRIQPLPATPGTGLPPSLLPSWASQITSQVVNSAPKSLSGLLGGETLCIRRSNFLIGDWTGNDFFQQTRKWTPY